MTDRGIDQLLISLRELKSLPFSVFYVLQDKTIIHRDKLIVGSFHVRESGQV